jgi:hypothetical protein
MKWIKFIVISLVVILTKVVVVAYYVSNRLEYKFVGFGTGISLANLGDSLNFNVEIFNPTMFTLRIKNLKIELVSKIGVKVGEFVPIDLNIGTGSNLVNMEFTDTNLGVLVQDYFQDFKNTDMVVSGKLIGIIPFKYRYPLAELVTE